MVKRCLAPEKLENSDCYGNAKGKLDKVFNSFSHMQPCASWTLAVFNAIQLRVVSEQSYINETICRYSLS